LQPVIEPTYGLVAPFIQGSVVTAVRPRVIPGTDPGLQRRGDLLQHAGNAVTVAIMQSADQEAGYMNRGQGTFGAMPERAIALVLEVDECPGLGIHSRSDDIGGETVIGCAAAALVEVHGQLVFIDMEDAVEIVHVLVASNACAKTVQPGSAS